MLICRDNNESQYNTVLGELLEVHAPSRNKTITHRPEAPWYNGGLRREKQVRRKLEKKIDSAKTPDERHTAEVSFRTQKNKVNKMIDQAKTSYYKEKIANAKDQKELFKVANSLLHKEKDISLPTHIS